MVREIKFRIFDKALKHMWCWGDLVDAKWSLHELFDTQGGDWSEVMQYTGLNDKNGKEIYEGDIFRTSRYPLREEDEYVGVVEYDIDRFWGVRSLKANSNARGISNGIADGMYEFVDDEIEVIGNIYQNADLIGEQS
ncbi:YopX family protein [Bacillus sp. FJAT-49736]|uniref:YopX family protein n=1 Tax=Bacillus sp. FJAT-49736 TaxID=2833582 RepID=UPI002015E630|nr:YopX family protein [Bacillus sp. FJAT-49736]